MQEIKREARYDERRKELHVFITEEKEFKIPGEDGKERNLGKIKIESNATYNEAGIRQLYKDAQRDKTNTEQAIKRLKDATKKEPTEQEIKDLEAHNKIQKRLKEIGDYRKNKNELKMNEEELKKVNGSINEIKAVIGTRLKL